MSAHNSILLGVKRKIGFGRTSAAKAILTEVGDARLLTDPVMAVGRWYDLNATSGSQPFECLSEAPKVVKLWVGTSGYSYKAWLGKFYPERLAAKEMLRATAKFSVDPAKGSSYSL